MDNVSIIKALYQHFAQGNIPAVLEGWDENIKWMGSKGFPIYDGDGIVIGAMNVVQQVLATIPELYDGFNIDIQDLYGSGNKVVMEGFYTGTYKATGKPFKANAVHIWDLSNGKVTRFFQAVDTAEIINA